MERYCNYVLSIWNDVLKFVTGKIVNKIANDGMEEVRVSALAYMLRYDKRTLDKRGRRKVRNSSLKLRKRFRLLTVGRRRNQRGNKRRASYRYDWCLVFSF